VLVYILNIAVKAEAIGNSMWGAPMSVVVINHNVVACCGHTVDANMVTVIVDAAAVMTNGTSSVIIIIENVMNVAVAGHT
jgi:hypothetical protein